MPFTLPETELLKLQATERSPYDATFILQPLTPGYGVTIGHSLRRVLLSSLEGAAVWTVRIEGVTHEFSTLPGLKEDIIELILNLKTLRIKVDQDEPAVLKLKKVGPADIRAKDFDKNSSVKIIDEDHYIGHLDKNGKIDIEVEIRRGRGYITTESRNKEKLPLGSIAIDASFAPIKKINYEVQSTRVGSRTDFDKLVLDLTTDGTITAKEALKTALKIIIEQFSVINSEFEKNVGLSAKPTKKTAKVKTLPKPMKIEKTKNKSKIKNKKQ